MARRDRASRGGGVAVIVDRNLSVTLLEQIPNHESLCLRVYCHGCAFNLIAVYRPPSADPDFLTKLQDHTVRLSKNCIIIASDFNLPHIDWSKLSSPSPSDEIIFDIMLASDLCQAVNVPTRVQGTSSTTLDLVFHSRSLSHVQVSVEEGISDHKLVYFSCHLGNSHPRASEKRKLVKNYSRANDESVLDYLELALDSFTHTDVNILWVKFKSVCHFCLDNFIPNRAKIVHRRNPWINRDIIHQIRKIKRHRKHKSNKVNLQTLRRRLTESIRASKKSYYSETVTKFLKTDPAKFWHHLKENGKTSIDYVSIDGEKIDDRKELASYFNRYFHSVFSKTSQCDTYHNNTDDLSSDFITYEGIFSMLLNLKPKSSCGPDCIPNTFLRRYAESLAHFLVILFRLSFSSGTVPPDWLIARVVAIFKKGDRTKIQNYRPISLTCTSCKLLEHCIANFMIKFLEDNNLLTPFQHGFRKGFSTTTQLVSTVHSLASTLDKSGQTDIIFMDFSKAFDLVSHSGLILKLNRLHFPSNLVKWISSYLNKRRQFVDVDGHYSDFLPVNSGVPQGSVLGPLLFLIYINDLTACIDESVTIRLFADDCLVYKEIKNGNDQVVLNNSISAISNWCDKWHMKLNLEKTVFMRVTNKKCPAEFQYCINDVAIAQTESFKYLGVTLTSHLTWSKHIDAVCASARRKLGLVRHRLKYSPPHVKLLAYNSLIRSRLEYACIVWDPFYKKDINKLEQINRLAVRFTYNRYKRCDSPTELMNANGISSLESRRKLARLKFLFHLWHQDLKLDSSTYLQPSTTRPTRHHHSCRFTPIFARTEKFKHSFFPRTIIDWNALPSHIFLSNDVPRSIEDFLKM